MSVFCLFSALAIPLALAAPADGVMVGGSARISSSGATTLVQQDSSRAVINWGSFNIAAGETVRFSQPDKNAIVLNRIAGGASTIDGVLRANGRVFLVNPQGILFGANAMVNTAGLLASTLDMQPADFMAGQFGLRGTGGTGNKVTNLGNISADQGYIVLAGGQVSNQGTLSARLGKVVLAGGSAMTLVFGNDGMPALAVTQGQLDALAENRQLIQAPGGEVLLTSAGVGTLLQSSVRNSGIIEARTLENRAGKILLLADMHNGTLTASGSLDASAPAGGSGGFIETSAAHVSIDNAIRVNTLASTGQHGDWLIDPGDFTVSAIDGNVSGATLSSQLQSGSIEIKTVAGSGGDVRILDPVSWSANTVLRITSDHGVDISSPVTATGASAGLVITAPSFLSIRAPVTLGGAGAGYTYNGQAYTLIHSMSDLLNVNNNLSGGAYALAQNLDASGTTYSGALIAPSSQFSGNFEGLGHTIDGLRINAPGVSTIGLFGTSSAFSSFRNFGLTNVNIVGLNTVGALMGNANGSWSNVYSTGTVSGQNSVGGLFGIFTYASLISGYSTATVNGSISVGGLVGVNRGSIKQSYTAGVVQGGSMVGGIAGGNVTGAGGLAGTVSDVYSTSVVSGTSAVGGLVGTLTGTTLARGYFSGTVSGTSLPGAVVGTNSAGTITASLWNTGSAGVATAVGSGSSAGTTGATAAALRQLSTFSAAGWDISGSGGETRVWRIYDGQTMPLLRDFLRRTTVSPVAWTYDGTTTGTTSYQANLSGAATSLLGGGFVASTGSANAGTYTLGNGLSMGSGLYSSQAGYDISYASSLTIARAALTVTAGDVFKTYDGLAFGAGNGVTYSGLVHGETGLVLGGTLVYGGAAQGATAAGSYGLTVAGLNSANYAISYLPGTLTVGKAALTVTANDAGKTFDGLAHAGSNGVHFSGLVNGEQAGVLGGTLVFGGAAQGAVHAGSYDITVSGLSSGNYEIAYRPGVLTVDRASLAVAANGLVKEYDGIAYGGGNGVRYSGFVAGETQALLGGALVYGGSAQGAIRAGRYTLLAGGLSSNDYAINYPAAQLVINPPPYFPGDNDVYIGRHLKTQDDGRRILADTARLRCSTGQYALLVQRDDGVSFKSSVGAGSPSASCRLTN